MTCKYDLPYRGPCGQPAGSSGYCEEHLGQKCTHCGAQATHDCPEAGSMSCGAPLCDNCTHVDGVGHRGKDDVPGYPAPRNKQEKEFTVLVRVSEMDEDTLGTTTRSVMKTVNATTAHQAILKIAKELDRGV